MSTSRRTFLAGCGVLAASSLLGSAAFSRTSADRSVTVDVAVDTDAYLGLEPTSPFATLVDGHLELTFDDTPQDIAGEGVNVNSEYLFVDTFGLINQGVKTIEILSVEVDEPSPDLEVTFLVENNPWMPLGDAVPLDPGDSINVTVEVDVADIGYGDYQVPITIVASA
ncbi:uncharacterized protein Nmag_3374 [Natrialba magadii ATCC 43099]|uniref:DUF1102 family protein n=1 Tax=Natrialba magadii (strain ATCC 43099 / DSM 3394 / CCM 3739 / CIP 104546 / IAM 13178 / JCM 8861 / NBRC 102185 / NCIMB 2190 / MS3) TaxID=547559 RepID=D3ST57_NATMM|nr:DUF1102 domain-containing protein [Natrialba magadii]ADD06924.1 uncharacterized protein Nmag_3374 [Natrialba magadii ATCC 43099]ELY28452.1 hypothetical protein C500_13357 [Natrialba magadii ATCC 43099]